MAETGAALSLLGNSEESDSESEEESESDGQLVEAAMSEESTWLSWFLSLKAHRSLFIELRASSSVTSHSFFCEVEEEFINDDFNLTGLNHAVSRPPSKLLAS